MKAVHPFRTSAPARTYSGADLASYQKYKKQLALDFRKRCGYTDCPDFWFGGMNAFHIDHRKPKSKHPHLERKYSNLIYACSHVNQAKSNDDADEYLDPCDVEYNDHFGRDAEGNIVPLPGSQEAGYMYTKLKLYLQRYGIIWTLETLEAKLDELRTLLGRVADSQVRSELLEQHLKVTTKFFEYKAYLAANQ
jgi:HNH endonuclease